MKLKPHAASDDRPGNEHPHSEQWLLVIDGVATATIGRRRSWLRKVRLEKHSLLVIEKGELHQIVNTGRRILTTIRFYVPPAYDAEGEPIQD